MLFCSVSDSSFEKLSETEFEHPKLVPSSDYYTNLLYTRWYWFNNRVVTSYYFFSEEEMNDAIENFSTFLDSLTGKACITTSNKIAFELKEDALIYKLAYL